MFSHKRWLPCLVLILRLQLMFCYETAEEEEVTNSKYAVSCAARKEISPCTCYQHGTKEIWIQVICQKMVSFNQIIETLRNKIERRNQIQLVIEFSDLEDLSERKFSDLESSIIHIWLRQNKMKSSLSTKSFEGIDTVTTLVLIESKISVFPGTIFQHMPNVEVVSIERTPIESVSPADFKSLTKLKTLVIRSCNLTYIESNTFPVTLKHIDLDGNNISTLNHTLRNNTLLEWVFLARNNIESMEGQLADLFPDYKLSFLDISFNKLTSFPKSFVELKSLSQLYANNNRIRRLDGILRNKRKLVQVELSENEIDWLASNEFENCGQLTHLNLSYNAISSLNRSLVPLQSLLILNLTHNNLTEFSLYELPTGLGSFVIDVSNNRLRKFVAFTENNGTQITLERLHLEFNELETLDGFMAGVQGLKYLNMSHNKLSTIRTEFLDNLNALQELDVSHNQLLTLHDILTSGLSSLRALYAINNHITELSEIPDSKLSTVCSSYLQNNKIENASSSEQNLCVFEPGFDFTLHIYLDGNDVLCKDNVQETINSVERSRNNTRIVGHCSKTSIEGVKYSVVPPPPAVNNVTADSQGTITVVTLEH